MTTRKRRPATTPDEPPAPQMHLHEAAQLLAEKQAEEAGTHAWRAGEVSRTLAWASMAVSLNRIADALDERAEN